MNYLEAKKLLEDNPYHHYQDHELMFSMSCIFEEDDGDYEIVFAVPADWLQSWCLRDTGKYKSFDEIKDWLQNEYTSEDSEDILEKAAFEQRVCFWFVDEHLVIPF